VEFTGLGWLGVRTERFEETVQFFRNVMGLQQANPTGAQRGRVRLP
jgi:hypothetical protein